MSEIYDLLPRIAEIIENEPHKVMAYKDYFAITQQMMKSDLLDGVDQLRWLWRLGQ